MFLFALWWRSRQHFPRRRQNFLFAGWGWGQILAGQNFPFAGWSWAGQILARQNFSAHSWYSFQEDKLSHVSSWTFWVWGWQAHFHGSCVCIKIRKGKNVVFSSCTFYSVGVFVCLSVISMYVWWRNCLIFSLVTFSIMLTKM